jgi:CheY-like chemotaxis protein
MITETNQRTILIVDDSDEIRAVLREFLKNSNYCILEAGDGHEAVTMAKHKCPDIILMDLYMPKMDGFTANRQIREQLGLSNVPIIAISAYGEFGINPILEKEALDSGFAGYLTKPIDFSHLEHLISQFLGEDK